MRVLFAFAYIWAVATAKWGRFDKVDKCEQPKETGPCYAAIPRFFFNGATGACEEFTYGGCRGNSNNFRSREQCENACGADESESASGDEEKCDQPLQVGPCKAAYKRYYYNAESGACERFTYGGCQGNSNNFKSMWACQKACDAEGDVKSLDDRMKTKFGKQIWSDRDAKDERKNWSDRYGKRDGAGFPMGSGDFSDIVKKVKERMPANDEDVEFAGAAVLEKFLDQLRERMPEAEGDASVFDRIREQLVERFGDLTDAVGGAGSGAFSDVLPEDFLKVFADIEQALEGVDLEGLQAQGEEALEQLREKAEAALERARAKFEEHRGAGSGGFVERIREKFEDFDTEEYINKAYDAWNQSKAKAEEAMEKAKASWKARQDAAAKWMGQGEQDWFKGAFSNRYGAGDWKAKFEGKMGQLKRKYESSDDQAVEESEVDAEEGDAEAEAEEAEQDQEKPVSQRLAKKAAKKAKKVAKALKKERRRMAA